MTMWAAMKSPLVMGTDIRKLSGPSLSIYTNPAINATLTDIFVDNGGAMSTEAQMSWDMYDLWANRMPNATANMILENNSTVGVQNVTNYYYNATKTSYAKGIMANETILMGTHVGAVEAMGTIAASVPRHGVMAYRLRPRGVLRKRDEL